MATQHEDYFSTFLVTGRGNMFKIQLIEHKWEYCLLLFILVLFFILQPERRCCHIGGEVKTTSGAATVEETGVPDSMDHHNKCGQPAQMFISARNKLLPCLSHCCFQNLSYIQMFDHVNQKHI